MLLQPVAPAGVVIHPYASAAFGEDSRKALPDILAVPCQSHAIWLAAGALAHQRLVGCRGRTSESLLEPASGFGVNALDKWAAANLQVGNRVGRRHDVAEAPVDRKSVV